MGVVLSVRVRRLYFLFFFLNFCVQFIAIVHSRAIVINCPLTKFQHVNKVHVSLLFILKHREDFSTQINDLFVRFNPLGT